MYPIKQHYRVLAVAVGCIALVTFQVPLAAARLATLGGSQHGLAAAGASGPYLYQTELNLGLQARAGDALGTSVALSANGQTALVGGIFANSSSIAAEVFQFASGKWSAPTILEAGAGTCTDRGYGCPVALSADGHTALVASRNAVYAFRLDNGTWGSPTSLGSGGTFVALDADGNTALVSTGGYGYAGAADVFRFGGGIWNKTAHLVPGGGYGVALSDDGNTALLGNSAGSFQPGTLEVFRFNAGNWSAPSTLNPGPASAGTDLLGDSVALSADGNTALSATREGWPQGTFAEFFTYGAGSWDLPVEMKLVSRHSTGVGDGGVVALSGDGATALVQAPNVVGGGAEVYHLAGGVWSRLMGISLPSPAVIDRFGSAMALSQDGGIALVGAPGRTVNGVQQAGAVEVFAADSTGVVLKVHGSSSFGAPHTLTGLAPNDPRISYVPAGEAHNVTGSLSCLVNAGPTNSAGQYDISSCHGLADAGRTIIYDYVNSAYVVTQAHVTLTYTGPASMKVGKDVTLSARLVSKVTGKPIAGRVLQLQIGNYPVPGGPVQSCHTGKTTSKGVGSCVIHKVRPRSSPNVVITRFAGEHNYFAAKLTVKVTIIK